jgi:hypothetical protein
MYESTVLICWRALFTPVPGAAGVRVKPMFPKSLRNVSNGSFALKVSGELSPLAVARSPNVWSKNWPQVKPHWLTRFSENRFWLVSLKMRLLVNRGETPLTCWPRPSA